jgi:RNA polymerase-binding transcription factor DksA
MKAPVVAPALATLARVNDPTSAPPDDHRADIELLDQAWTELGAVEAALNRLEDGSYWMCEECGLPLDAEALASDPLMTHCAHHFSDDLN